MLSAGRRSRLSICRSREVVRASIEHAQKNRIVVTNSSSRRITLSFGSDPDLRIQEELGAGHVHNKVAVEIKGGTDRSNAHNRAGEAAKSHQKARAQGFNDFWTIIAQKGLNLALLGRTGRCSSWHRSTAVQNHTIGGRSHERGRYSYFSVWADSPVLAGDFNCGFNADVGRTAQYRQRGAAFTASQLNFSESASSRDSPLVSGQPDRPEIHV